MGGVIAVLVDLLPEIIEASAEAAEAVESTELATFSFSESFGAETAENALIDFSLEEDVLYDIAWQDESGYSGLTEEYDVDAELNLEPPSAVDYNQSSVSQTIDIVENKITGPLAAGIVIGTSIVSGLATGLIVSLLNKPPDNLKTNPPTLIEKINQNVCEFNMRQLGYRGKCLMRLSNRKGRKRQVQKVNSTRGRNLRKKPKLLRYECRPTSRGRMACKKRPVRKRSRKRRL